MAFAIWCVIIAGVMPYFTVGIAKAKGPGYDNAKPRQWMQTLEGLPARADAAHRNQLEGFPLFAAAVIFAEMRQINVLWLDLLAGAFIVFRIFYTVCYLANWSNLRSVVWTCGLSVCVALLILAAIA
jgi:uncharacterized MAPEG superfamily protein